MFIKDATTGGFSGEDLLSDWLGKVDNLHDPVPILNYRSVTYGLLLFLLILSTVSASLRLYVRFRVTRCPGWDDLFIFLSLLAGIGLSITIFVGFNNHFGEHFLTFGTNLVEVARYSKAAYFTNAMYPTATSLIKIAILLQFLRLFEVKSKYHTATLIMFYITCLWGLAFSLISWFPAIPVSAFWDLTNQTAIRYGIASLKVNEFTGTMIALNATNVALDVVILAIPIPYYVGSSLTRKTRLSLAALFALGILINGIALARLVSVVKSRSGTYPTLDPSFYGTSQLVLTSLEASLAIIAASLPVFWPMMKFGWGEIFVTTVITVQHQDGNEVPNGARSYASPWNWGSKAEVKNRREESQTHTKPWRPGGPAAHSWKRGVQDRSSVDTKMEERYEDTEALVIKPLPGFKTWIASKDDEKQLAVTPLQDFKDWMLTREYR